MTEKIKQQYIMQKFTINLNFCMKLGVAIDNFKVCFCFNSTPIKLMLFRKITENCS